MRYRPKSIAALNIALCGLPAQMRFEVESGIEIRAKTVGDFRKLTVWPENLAPNDEGWPSVALITGNCDCEFGKKKLPAMSLKTGQKSPSG